MISEFTNFEIVSMRQKLLGSTAPPPEIKSKKPAATEQYGIPPPPYVAAAPVDTAPVDTAVQLLPHQRQGDRGNSDAAGPGLRRYVRFNDLVAAGIVTNWVTLGRLQNEQGFPRGILLGPNTRAWAVDEINQWLATRPTARKVAVPRSRKAQAEVSAI